MSQAAHSSGLAAPAHQGPEPNSLVDWMLVLARRKRLLLALPLLCGAVGIALALLLPNIYKSEARILPPQQNTGAAALLGQLGGSASLASGALGIGNSNDLYLGILRSRTVADRLIQRFDLRRGYGAETADMARAELAARTTLRAGKDNIIVISFEDRSAPLAQQLANAYVEELSRVSRTLAMTDGARRRLFYERELELAKDRLAQAELTLRAKLDTHGVVSVDSQSAALVATIARLRAQVSLKEVELNAMHAFVTVRSQQHQRAAQELNSLRTQLARLEGGGKARSVPAAPGAMDNIKTLRDVKHYQMLYELLAGQFEAARLAEMRDPAGILVIDSAVVAENKSKPQRALIVLLAAFSGLCLSIVWICGAEYMRRLGATPGRVRSGQYGVA